LVLSVYPSEVGLLTLGGFYKTVDHLIWYATYHLPAFPVRGFSSAKQFAGAAPGALLTTYVNNPNPSYVRGVEFDWQTHLWYLPRPFSGIVLDLTYAHVWGDTKYPIVKTVTSYDSVTALPTTAYVDSARAGRLQDQPADIMNLSLGYDYEGFSGRLTLMYTGSTLRMIGSRPETDGETKEFLRVDLALRQRLPWENLQLFLNLNNITDRMDEATQRAIQAPTLLQFYGFTADIGIRWTL
jgi:hypothetical protein